jgi:hypothetical protein
MISINSFTSILFQAFVADLTTGQAIVVGIENAASMFRNIWPEASLLRLARTSRKPLPDTSNIFIIFRSYLG